MRDDLASGDGERGHEDHVCILAPAGPVVQAPGQRLPQPPCPQLTAVDVEHLFDRRAEVVGPGFVNRCFQNDPAGRGPAFPERAVQAPAPFIIGHNHQRPAVAVRAGPFCNLARLVLRRQAELHQRGQDVGAGAGCHVRGGLHLVQGQRGHGQAGPGGQLRQRLLFQRAHDEVRPFRHRLCVCLLDVQRVRLVYPDRKPVRAGVVPGRDKTVPDGFGGLPQCAAHRQQQGDLLGPPVKQPDGLAYLPDDGRIGGMPRVILLPGSQRPLQGPGVGQHGPPDERKFQPARERLRVRPVTPDQRVLVGPVQVVPDFYRIGRYIGVPVKVGEITDAFPGRVEEIPLLFEFQRA